MSQSFGTLAKVAVGLTVADVMVGKAGVGCITMKIKKRIHVRHYVR